MKPVSKQLGIQIIVGIVGSDLIDKPFGQISGRIIASALSETKITIPTIYGLVEEQLRSECRHLR